jgi:hypothetical protein
VNLVQEHFEELSDAMQRASMVTGSSSSELVLNQSGSNKKSNSKNNSRRSSLTLTPGTTRGGSAEPPKIVVKAFAAIGHSQSVNSMSTLRQSVESVEENPLHLSSPAAGSPGTGKLSPRLFGALGSGTTRPRFISFLPFF